jgi:hypothetical protein
LTQIILSVILHKISSVNATRLLLINNGGPDAIRGYLAKPEQAPRPLLVHQMEDGFRNLTKKLHSAGQVAAIGVMETYLRSTRIEGGSYGRS